MTPQQLNAFKNLYRVKCNLKALLDCGMFEGKYAMGLAECKSLVESELAEIKKQMEPALIIPESAKTPGAEVKA